MKNKNKSTMENKQIKELVRHVRNMQDYISDNTKLKEGSWYKATICRTIKRNKYERSIKVGSILETLIKEWIDNNINNEDIIYGIYNPNHNRYEIYMIKTFESWEEAIKYTEVSWREGESHLPFTDTAKIEQVCGYGAPIEVDKKIMKVLSNI